MKGYKSLVSSIRNTLSAITEGKVQAKTCRNTRYKKSAAAILYLAALTSAGQSNALERERFDELIGMLNTGKANQVALVSDYLTKQKATATTDPDYTVILLNQAVALGHSSASCTGPQQYRQRYSAGTGQPQIFP